MTQFTTAHIGSIIDMLQPDNRFIGFDTMFDRLERNVQYHDTNFPVYNVVHNKENDSYVIELALAGYSDDDITITVDDQTLIIKGDKGEDQKQYTHKGIAFRKFEKRWTLGEYMVVQGASFENGLLKIEIDKVIPDEKKPRVITIGKKNAKKTLLKG
jgi:molecular chaperone IbpA